MNPLLEQFLSEGRDCLQGIGEKLMQLEKAPDDGALMTEVFRLVHTLKGNSGLFELPEMTRVLHAGEDLLDAVRHGRIAYSQGLADRLLDAMDFVGMLCDEIEGDGQVGSTHAGNSVRLADSLRELLVASGGEAVAPQATADASPPRDTPAGVAPAQLGGIPEAIRHAAFAAMAAGKPLFWVSYTPHPECFFQGSDPFFQSRQTPELLWGDIVPRAAWPALAELDAYRCQLDFHILSNATRTELDEYFRYMPDQIAIVAVRDVELILPQGEAHGGPIYEDFASEALAMLEAGDHLGLGHAVAAMLDLSSSDLWMSSALRWLALLLEHGDRRTAVLRALIDALRTQQAPDWQRLTDTPSAESPAARTAAEPTPSNGPAPISDEALAALREIVATQRQILALPITADWQLGRIRAVVATLANCLSTVGYAALIDDLHAAGERALAERSAAAVLAWLDAGHLDAEMPPPAAPIAEVLSPEPPTVAAPTPSPDADSDIKFGRRAEDAAGSAKSLKVDQIKIDRLMNLIGEMVVSKNALPYLATRAESVFGVRELAREIKAQYAVINRIAEEMQDAIMQVRMMPVSFVFQRFPRLVRDTARRLGKEVSLVLEGEETEADKNIIESLSDPLIHIVRNSLDHGFESPEERRAAGKPEVGTLTIRALQESDRAIIEIIDDGRGIDPQVVKQKAYEKGLIDEIELERISDQEAINLVFRAGFSTTEVVSDLSGRGVGMDVVKTAIEKVNGSIVLDSVKGRGTQLRLSLPLSMAVTNVMIVESDHQIFGVPMDSVVETVRVPRSAIRTIKRSMATVLRDRIVPLKGVNDLLGLAAPQLANDEDELAVLVVRYGEESVGLVVDDFRETIDIILKPMTGVLAGLPIYSGSALMGDGSVLMVLNVKEML